MLYVAKEPIPYGTVLAYNTGDSVHPSALVSAGGWVEDDLVTAVADDADGRPERVGSVEPTSTTDLPDEGVAPETADATSPTSTPKKGK